MLTKSVENINNSFFSGHYKDIWRSLIPEALTRAEVDWLVEEAQLKPGSRVLDLMCGYGRHALALARKGVEVTAVDNLADYINEVHSLAENENLRVRTVLEDVIRFETEAQFDCAICMGNSLCFFDKDESAELFHKIHSWLGAQGKFIFNSWTIAEIVIKQFKEKAWGYAGELKLLTDSRYVFSPARIETEAVIMAPDGSSEVKMSIDYIYSLNETENMLNESGFRMKETWSIPGKKKFTINEPRIYIVAEKI